jgi:signal transduction histidine kinase
MTLPRMNKHDVAGLISTVLGGLFLCAQVTAAHADSILSLPSLPALTVLSMNDVHVLTSSALIAGLGMIVAAVALLHLRARSLWAKREAQWAHKNAVLRAELDRADVLMGSEPHIVIAYGSSTLEPIIQGDPHLIDDGASLSHVLAFGSWMKASDAQTFEASLAHLRERGEAFRHDIATLSGRYIEADGRTVGSYAVVRFRNILGDRLDLMRLRERHAKTICEIDSFHALVQHVPSPLWIRDHDGRLVWVNQAYVRAVDGRDQDDVISRSLELLDRPVRDAVRESRGTDHVWRGRVAAVVAGERHMVEVYDIATAMGSIGMSYDLAELQSVRADLEHQMEAHTRTLDQLSTAVAIFDRTKHLVFYNTAYRQVWGLDSLFLDQKPSDSEILDHLRGQRKLPEQADFRAWKASLLTAYTSVESSEQVWYLPDGRTLRMVVSPNPQGGVTYLFDDVTARFHLESSYNALIRVQGETLDTLKEGVAVFGSDGRLRLFNHAFAAMWALDQAQLNTTPHIDEVALMCAHHEHDQSAWAQWRDMVVGVYDARTGLQQRITLSDGRILDSACAPLPDGSTLITFTDVTAGVNVERALTERNQALLEAERLKNDFVHHVSYELRSPLTNIIGFIQLLGNGSVGTLNERQLEYIGYVMKSSSALLAIINDILDLATIDNDALLLDREDIDIYEIVESAAQGLQDRLQESAINLNIVALSDIGTFRADKKRMRQILFNLLSNAIGFSSSGQSITLAALRRGDSVVFKVTDQGRGIPADVLEHVFDRFKTYTNGSRHRGVGLGLSIVRSLVELHGGEVQIQSALNEGTTVTCIFPARDEVKVSASVA